MGTTEYQNPATSATVFTQSTAPKKGAPDPEPDTDEDDSGSGVGHTLSLAFSGVRDAIAGDDEPAPTIDPETLAAARRYIEQLYPGQQHLHHMSDLSAQLGHPMSTDEISSGELADREKANDLEQRRLLDTLGGNADPSTAAWARSQPNQHALWAAVNPTAHEASVMAGQVPAIIANHLAQVKQDYELARQHVAEQTLRDAYNSIPDEAVRTAQAVLGGARRAEFAQKAANAVKALMDPAAAHAMTADPAAVPAHMGYWTAKRVAQAHQIIPYIQGGAGPSGPTPIPFPTTTDKASE